MITMNRTMACLALLAFVALPAAAAGAAQRGAAVREPVKRVADNAVGDPAAWTKRLVGRFRLDGIIHHEYEIIDHGPRDADPRGPFNVWDVSLRGKSDCIDFTEAAGLQCVVNVSWQEQWMANLKVPLGGVPDLTPGMLLAGLAPTTAPGQIRILQVDRRGIAHPGAVELRGTSASATLPCVNMPGTQKCVQKFTITAKPDSQLIFMTFSTTVRAIRSKLERKQILDTLPDDRTERSTELYEERITVSFSLRREAEHAAAPLAPPPERPSRRSR